MSYRRRETRNAGLDELLSNTERLAAVTQSDRIKGT
jgi:hypothetical protein